MRIFPFLRQTLCIASLLSPSVILAADSSDDAALAAVKAETRNQALELFRHHILTSTRTIAAIELHEYPEKKAQSAEQAGTLPKKDYVCTMEKIAGNLENKEEFHFQWKIKLQKFHKNGEVIKFHLFLDKEAGKLAKLSCQRFGMKVVSGTFIDIWSQLLTPENSCPTASESDKLFDTFATDHLFTIENSTSDPDYYWLKGIRQPTEQQELLILNKEARNKEFEEYEQGSRFCLKDFKSRPRVPMLILKSDLAEIVLGFDKSTGSWSSVNLGKEESPSQGLNFYRWPVGRGVLEKAGQARLIINIRGDWSIYEQQASSSSEGE